jgi:hypothetical protein
MLIDKHDFPFVTAVPWPSHHDYYVIAGEIEFWLDNNIGWHHKVWAWNDSQAAYLIGLAFRWDQDRTFFLLHWTETGQ